MVPGVILIVGLGLLATYTGYNIGLMRERYPHIQNLADAGEILMGSFGRELFGLGQFLFCIFVMGSHILTFRVMMNTITEHGTCSVVFSLVGMLISLFLSIPRTMKGMTWISFACEYNHCPNTYLLHITLGDDDILIFNQLSFPFSVPS